MDASRSASGSGHSGHRKHALYRDTGPESKGRCGRRQFSYHGAPAATGAGASRPKTDLSSHLDLGGPDDPSLNLVAVAKDLDHLPRAESIRFLLQDNLVLPRIEVFAQSFDLLQPQILQRAAQLPFDKEDSLNPFIVGYAPAGPPLGPGRNRRGWAEFALLRSL